MEIAIIVNENEVLLVERAETVCLLALSHTSIQNHNCHEMLHSRVVYLQLVGVLLGGDRWISEAI